VQCPAEVGAGMHLVDTTLFYSPNSGGVRRYLTAKHAWLGANTHHRHTLLVPGDTTHFEPGGISTIRGLRVPGTFNYRLPLTPRLWTSMLDRLHPDLIEVGDAFHPAWSAIRVAQPRHIPVVAFFHSNLPQILGRRMGTFTERAVQRYVGWLYRRCDLVLTPSRLMCEYLASLGIERTALQPLGVDTENFAPRQRVLDLRRELGLADNTRLLVYAGRFSGEKNIHVLHEAMRMLGAPYHLLLIGGGEHARPAANITVSPYRRDSSELAQWLASADALVHAGCSETFGLVLLEAMACGRPVIGARAGAVPEFVDEQVGMLAEPDDAVSMASAIADLYDRDLEALGRAARARVLARYTWTHALQHLLATYASISSLVRPEVPGQRAAVLGNRRAA
jgi:alpha-1,6-mannosyltransferase